MPNPANSPQLILDGYGLLFDPVTYWKWVSNRFVEYEQEKAARLALPPVEPVWEDRPAGFKKCVPLAEDKECEKFLH